MARQQSPQRVRGTQDIFGDDERRFTHVVETFDRLRRLYCFQRVEVPTFEETQVFARSIGETTDVVAKEMYTFPDRGGDSLTLRPEFTAGIARAYLSEGWQQYAPLRLATSGSVFRYERPQKGRYREFHQIDAEILGAAEPTADVELLALADQLLAELGIAQGVTLQLNTLGDAATRDAWRAALVAHFEGHRGELSEDSLVRLAKNPLRILDSKDPRDRPIADAAPGIDAFMSAEAGAFFEAVQKGLQASGVAFVRNERLVRGLDYYRHTAFEFVTDRLGAQGTVLAGGRYDGLIESLGGAPTPGVGWAAGIERLAMLVEGVDAPRLDVVLAVEDDGAIDAAWAALGALRRAGLSAEMIATGSPRKRYDKAAKLGAGVLVSARAEGLTVKDGPDSARVREIVGGSA
ncbi:histidyl-tRNA synthetase [Sphingomonas jinjuensis]|uniref:Histidine--tRNA ligase n=1 Tax=Sphingomonas jinjuensis TaxID=535907 RepID=A0A840FBL7_9SPHN|nr:histidine--tRNA ligase [Sphingomonas jinjuensis]MBB4153636.1 histidyl-tRNA synthetase [Sphingomonas jinjuensis]